MSPSGKPNSGYCMMFLEFPYLSAFFWAWLDGSFINLLEALPRTLLTNCHFKCSKLYILRDFVMTVHHLFLFSFFLGSAPRGVFQLSFVTIAFSSLLATVNDYIMDGLFFSFCYQTEALFLCLGQDFREIDNMFGYRTLSAIRERLVEQKMQLLMYQHGQLVE
jgi:hypothetical protein